MNWLNAPTSIIHAPEYVGSEPTDPCEKGDENGR
jgi:hypothetical protein